MKSERIIISGMLVIALLFACGCQDEENPLPRVNIHLAALQGNIHEIRQHIKSGSDLNRKDEYGSTPLIIAITFDKADVALALIEAGADLTIANNEGSTPLHIAAFFCREQIVRALLDKGVDKSVKNGRGMTALESVEAPFDAVKPIYDAIGSALQPLGFRLDYERVRGARPIIAEMLR